MAGHSKWAQIKRKKAVTDARRGKLWTKLLKEVTVAARLGGGDPAGDPRLRTAIQEAKASNVPNANIDRAIKKGTGELGGSDFEEITYEGYGPSGVAVLVEAMTDNRNRTVSDLRHLFTKYGGNLGENGCVSWIFSKRGMITAERSVVAEDELMDLAIELGADDFNVEDDAYEVLTPPEAYHVVLSGLESNGIPVTGQGMAMLPSNTVHVGADSAPSVLKLMEMIEDHDDVQNVWANFDIDAELLTDVN